MLVGLLCNDCCHIIPHAHIIGATVNANTWIDAAACEVSHHIISRSQLTITFWCYVTSTVEGMPVRYLYCHVFIAATTAKESNCGVYKSDPTSWHQCHVFIARGNNKRGFSGFNEGVYLNSYRDYTQQIYHTLSHFIAHKRESSSNALVDSVLVIPGHSLVPCAPESWSSADFTGLLLNRN
jgi:hypothetical protein